VLVKDHQTVQPSGRRLRRWPATLGVMTVAIVLGGVAVAGATVPPDLSDSTLVCADSDGGALRVGDDIGCTLTAKLQSGTENANITATVPLPPEVDFGSAAPPASYDAGTRTITFGAQALGFTFSSQQRAVVFHVTAAQALVAGTAISLSSEVTAVGDLDEAVVQQTVTSPALTVSPLLATLVDSTVGCSDDNGGTLLPGEVITCQLDVINAAGHEDASGVTGAITLSHATWLTGGSSSVAGSTAFGTSDLGDVASGDHRAVSATFIVSPTALGGDLVDIGSFVVGLSTQSSAPIFLNKTGTSLVVSPGPARLFASSLICSDSNSGLLLAGDVVACAVSVSPAAGHEDIQSTTAAVDIPSGAEYVSGGDGHDGKSVSFAGPSFGSVVAAGSTASAPFSIRISSPTPVGTVLSMNGAINATSVPVGGPVTQALTGPTLIVGREVIQPGQVPTAPAVTPTGKPPVVAASKGYKLKAKTIRIVMRRGHRRRNHVWNGSRRQFRYVKKYVVRTPKISGKVVKKVTVPKKGKYAPRRGKVKIKGTRLTYTVKKGLQPKDRFHYTVVDTNGKKATGFVVISRRQAKKKQ
jgi:hypothetical protein